MSIIFSEWYNVIVVVQIRLNGGSKGSRGKAWGNEHPLRTTPREGPHLLRTKVSLFLFLIIFSLKSILFISSIHVYACYRTILIEGMKITLWSARWDELYTYMNYINEKKRLEIIFFLFFLPWIIFHWVFRWIHWNWPTILCVRVMYDNVVKKLTIVFVLIAVIIHELEKLAFNVCYVRTISTYWNLFDIQRIKNL